MSCCRIARVLEGNLRATWARLQPVCADLLKEAGVQEEHSEARLEPDFRDFIWAYTIFW